MQFLIFSLFFLNAFSATMKTSPAMVLKQSANFLSTLANADPTVVNKMITMVGDLEVAGQKEKETVIAAAAAAEKFQAQKSRELTQAQEDLNAANEDFATVTGQVNQLTADEKTKRALLSAATKKRDSAQTAADDAKSSLIAISNRVTEEKKAFVKVLALLDSVVVPKGLLTIGRSLLSYDAADPDAIAAVKAQVVALDAAADKEVADATAVNTAAQELLVKCTKAFDEASEAHTAVAGALKEATEDLVVKTTTKNNAITAEDVASKAHAKAVTATNEAIQFRDDEVERIAVEAKALAEAKALLKTLL